MIAGGGAPIELGGFDQGVDVGGALAADVGPGKEVALATEGKWPGRSFSGILDEGEIDNSRRRKRPASPSLWRGNPGGDGPALQMLACGDNLR